MIISGNIYRLSKRFFDIIFSIILLPIIMPMIVVIFFVVIIDSGWPVFFTQRRVGLNGKEFNIIKFRTMTFGERKGRGYREKEYFTRIGGFLRKFHLDELPQIFFVLSGLMSFVGPRPLLKEHLEGFKDIDIRQSVKPGLTCHSQNILFEHKFLDTGEQIRFDVSYVQNAGLLVDFRILWMTFWLHLKQVFSFLRF